VRVLFLSDVHANFPALWRALESAWRRGAERVVCAGDLVGFGPHPVEVLRLLRERGVLCIRGNVERKVLGLLSESPRRLRNLLPKKNLGPLAWTALQLGEEERGFLEGLPERLEMEIEGVRVLVVHGSPRKDTDYLYPSLTPAALLARLGPDRPGLLVCGHSHIPFARRVGGVLVVNCGSAGKPVDGDPRGAYAVADLRNGRVRAEIVRFAYPVERVVRDLRERRAGARGVEAFAEGRKASDDDP
jgi:putative phosphoesterase